MKKRPPVLDKSKIRANLQSSARVVYLLEPRNNVPKNLRPGNFLLNETNLLRFRTSIESRSIVIRVPSLLAAPLAALLSLVGIRNGRACSWGYPRLEDVSSNSEHLLKTLGRYREPGLPNHLEVDVLRELENGHRELVAMRFGDVETLPRGDKYLPVSIDYLFHSNSSRPRLFVGQLPSHNQTRAEFFSRLSDEDCYVETTAIQLFYLIRQARRVTIGVSTLHFFAAALGRPDEVHFPPIGILSPTRFPGLGQNLPSNWRPTS